ncbi:hypothetical protein WL76_01060 [Burkholderia ubonensis]|nr:hypothetical protein WL76_01060 [Burkholderia ubonensis]
MGSPFAEDIKLCAASNNFWLPGAIAFFSTACVPKRWRQGFAIRARLPAEWSRESNTERSPASRTAMGMSAQAS